MITNIHEERVLTNYVLEKVAGAKDRAIVIERRRHVATAIDDIDCDLILARVPGHDPVVWRVEDAARADAAMPALYLEQAAAVWAAKHLLLRISGH